MCILYSYEYSNYWEDLQSKSYSMECMYLILVFDNLLVSSDIECVISNTFAIVLTGQA